MSVKSCAGFFALLGKSKALEPATLEELQRRHTDESDPRHLARKLTDEGVLTDWQARVLLSGRHRLTIGGYVLLERFSRQAAGDRFVALHRPLDRKVDVLVFPAAASKNRKLFQRFLDQASAVAQLDHRNLLHVYDIDQERGRYFVVFEHDEGELLKNIPAGRLGSRQVASVIRQCLDGIGYAHDNGTLHGKLDASQVRVDENEKATILNVGLARLLDQLQEQGDDVDEPAVTADPADDIAALGRMGQNLFREQIGPPLTDSDRELYRLLGEVGHVTESDPDSAAASVRKLGQWLDRFDSEHASENVLAAPTNLQAESRDQSRDPSQDPSPGANQEKPADPRRETTRQKRLLTVGMFIALAGVAGAIWVVVSNQQRSDNPPSANKRLETQSAAVETARSPEPRQDPVQKTPVRARDDFPVDPDQDEPISRVALQVRPPGSPGSRAQEDTAEVTDSNAIPGIPGNEAPDPPSGAPQDETASPRSDTQVIFEGAAGLPLVEWSNARDFVGKEAVVFGKIRSVGSSGPFRFMNFRPRSGAGFFTVVVNERDWDITADKLRSTYDEKNILIRGQVELYERTDTPQIVAASAEQIKIVPELPVAGSAPLVVGPGGGMTRGNSDTTGPGAFGKIGKAFSIPELVRDQARPEKTLLGTIAVGEDPLGMFLTVPEEACERPVYFELQRDETSRRRWEVFFAPRPRDAEATRYVAGEFTLEDDQLFFRWNEQPEYNLLVNYLRNCLLELKTQDESKTVILREPRPGPAIVLDEKQPKFRERLDLKYLPRSEALRVGIHELPRDEFETQFTDYGFVLDGNQPQTEIYFNKLPDQQFFRLWFSADFSTTIRLESALQLNAPGFPLYSRNNVGKFEQLLMQEQVRISRLNQAAIEYEAPYGEKTKHKENKKKLSAQLEQLNAQVAALQTAKPLVQRLLGRQLGYRIYFVVGDIEFDLLTSGGDNSGESESKSGETISGKNENAADH